MSSGQRGDDADALDLDADPALDADLDGEPTADGPRGGASGSGPGGSGSGGSRWTRWPEAVPGWARGPAAVVVLVLAAAVGGAAAGSSHRDARDQRVALQRALTVGYAFVAAPDRRGGALAAQVHVALVNHTESAVDVRLQGLSTPHQGAVAPPEPQEVQVGPGSVAAAPVAVRVDCEAVRGDARMQAASWRGAGAVDLDPGTGSAVGAAAAAPVAVPTVVFASVRTPGGGSPVDVQLPVVESIATSIDQQLGWACGAPSPSRLETGWLWKDDGSLRVSITAPAGAAPVRLELDSTAGLEPTSEPPLPRDLGPGETVVLDLRVDPRCPVVEDGALSRLDLQAVDGNGTTVSLGQGFNATTPVAGTPQWLARQVALACG
ncbi:hypothetical protein [Quadrisphaera sp. KR29]|uniref:hypothetical protein n=1 Tax=Quadrisphaera sp. KR29 TaxID=3461391 RepID=UPI0040447899